MDPSEVRIRILDAVTRSPSLGATDPEYMGERIVKICRVIENWVLRPYSDKLVASEKQAANQGTLKIPKPEQKRTLV